MAWSCMAASEGSTLAFADDFVAERRNRIKAEVYRSILYA